MKTVLRYAAVSALLTTVAFLTLAHFRDRSAQEAFQERRLEVIARAVAFVAEQEDARDDDAAEDSTQRFAAGVEERVEGVDEVFVLKRVKFLAHTDETRVGKRLERDSLSDKALYDASKALIADVKKNVEERERHPELKRNAFPEGAVERDGDALTVMVPVKDGEKARAVVQVTAKPIEASSPFPFMVVLVGVIGFVLIAVLSFLLRGPTLLAIGTVVTAVVILVQALAYVGWTAQSDVVHRARLAQTYGTLAEVGLIEAETEGASAVAALRETAKGVPDKLLVRLAPAGDAGAPEPGVAFDHAGYRVTYDRDLVSIAGMSSTTIAWAIAFGLVGCGLFLLGGIGQVDRSAQVLWGHREAYAYMSSAMIGMAVLVFIPVVYGIALGFQKRTYNEFGFVGLANYFEILSDFNVSEPTNFYFTLAVTIMWTVVNVVLHVSIGLFLALLLNDQFLKSRALFRVVLILPWAIPNYITALIWKGMFHKQFGAINLFLDQIGVGGIAWFQTFWPAFFANVATNTWLGFPFMMVVSLGALQSIPADLYEAAIVDGASRWQRFRQITLPLLMPALVPAVIVGSVWTFNMFNIIYLVSGGAPNGGTDILITDAFRWYFERDRPGYAAAYSTLIFIILAVFTTITNRVTGATKGAFE